ncbi:MAG: hypothetical protein H6713_31250 [Myxococcales bacterium]|nr:hypothetical protein [Myxococcales bacterium]MCB9754438.1 hypothetical protein [Myxococcales bacterium]
MARKNVAKNAPEEETAEPGPDDFGPPFTRRSFGGEFLWAQGDSYAAKVLRVRAGENVIVSTKDRKDMVVMLTGGRGVLEMRAADNVDRVELEPAAPVEITSEYKYRLLAVTDVELFVIHSPL